jgi:hypothetical protein
VRYHNRYIFYSMLYQSLATSMRAVRQPNGLYRAWCNQPAQRMEWFSSLSDKDGNHHARSRLLSIPVGLSAHYAHLRVHDQYVAVIPGLWSSLKTRFAQERPFFAISPDFSVEPLTPVWMATALKKFTSFDIPVNFHRAFLRTELLKRGCPPETIDCFLGHANAGESPFSKFSTFDYHWHFERLSKLLGEILDELGFRPIASRLVPFQKRQEVR